MTKTDKIPYLFLVFVIIIFSYCKYYGCGYESFNLYNTQTKVEEYFRRLFQNDSFRAENKYDCALKCSSYEGANYSVYFKTICQCIVNLNTNLDRTTNYCLEECTLFYDLYCQGHTGLLFYAIERQNTAETVERLNVYNMTSLNCLVIAKGVYKTKQMAYCKRKMRNIYCDGIENSIIFRIRNKYLQWTCSKEQNFNGKKYFRVISRTINGDITTAHAKADSITCTTTTTITTATTTTATTTTTRVHDLCIRIIVGAAIFLGTVIVFLLVVVYILRRKLRKASYACLTVRRDQNIYNEITQHSSVTGQYHEISPLSEMSSSGYRPTDQHNIDQTQHVDISGYLIPSSTIQARDDQYETI